MVFGERNSGTNFVSSLLKSNFPRLEECRGDNGRNGFRHGWKHGFPAMIAAPKDMIAVCVFRHPESWIGSLHRMPWHVHDSLRDVPISEFVRREWHCVIDHPGFGVPQDDPRFGAELQWDRDPVTGQRFANVLQLRNAKNRAFLSLAARFDNHVLVRYEDVAAMPEAFIESIRSLFRFKGVPEFRPVLTERGQRRTRPYQSKAYAPLTDADRAFIWSELDRTIEAEIGYAPPGGKVPSGAATP